MDPITLNPSGKGRVLVTGGTGFLGAYILRELVERGYSVRAIRRDGRQPFYIAPGILDKVEWVPGDIMDPIGMEEAMEGVDAVIHAAAKVSFDRKERHTLYATNIEGTANVVNAAIAQGIHRFVHVSSVAALGRTKKEEKVTEEKKWESNKHQTSYAISKFYGELEVWRAIGEGLPAVIVNPSTILGYGDWNTSSCAIFKNVYREFPWYSNGINGFVDVTDVSAAIVALLESDITGQRFILNADNWSFRQLFNNIAAAFEKKPPHREATPFLGAIAWRLEKIKSMFSGHRPLLTRESARVAQSRTMFDNSKILRQLPGFRFTPLEKTIQGACNAYRLLKAE
ncbi:NAD-dependent epimerase/dehydratase family protein [Flavitalea sp. BT771]|uniref:NAD-dependent epimerase/dehydratase family protein n=1 Tax=Flavitalea sp. BT771 TaxID=3063329 RepID=UPI0026E1C140|nr:NAD-dependent epimerase/dehydratase family protein [Flavitalea sp. BT771]MDO6434270.1 NAD-dependent epimerase/dehydratase family protein [Flavitalea sp. BT771]MDV6223170.1 NAD-dependent epimerase/dehydratase family protein [Flavitalea sp. BT771]